MTNHVSARVVSISGNIGAGKSTMLKHLTGLFDESHDIVFVPEPVDEWAYFLSKVYKNESPACSDAPSYAYRLQDKILSSFSEIAETYIRDAPRSKPRLYIVERSPQDSMHIFLEPNRVRFTEQEFTTLQARYALLERTEAWRNVQFVYIDTPADQCYQRMKRRCRECEETVDREYIRTLGDRYESFFNRLTPERVVRFDNRATIDMVENARSLHSIINCMIDKEHDFFIGANQQD